jgi:hypothetical protein
MASEIYELAIEIVRFVDDYQPGIVECKFVDATGENHIVIEKVPIVSTLDLRVESQYPQRGSIKCVVLNRWHDNGRAFAQIGIAQPDCIESTEGLREFIVLQEQLRS